ncbi:hypothetical protein ACEQ8H_001394 [Pleosporales sp. CAS-2024a]
MDQAALTEEQLDIIADRARAWQVRRFCQVLPSIVEYDRRTNTSGPRFPTSEPDGALAALLRCVIYDLDADIAMVSLLDEHTQYFVSGATRSKVHDPKVTLESTQWYGCQTVSHHGGLCERTITQQHDVGSMAFYEERDMLENDRTKHLPFVNGDLATYRYYAGVPINPYQGPNIGTVFFFRTRPSEASSTHVVRSYLAEVAHHVSKHLEQAVEALQGRREARFNEGIAALLKIDAPVDVDTEIDKHSLNDPSGQQNPNISNQHTAFALHVYQAAAGIVQDIFGFDAVRIQEVGPSGAFTNLNPDWNGSRVMAHHVGPGLGSLGGPSDMLLHKLLDMFPRGAVFFLASDTKEVVAATAEQKPFIVSDDVVSTGLSELSPEVGQICLMPLWDTYHESNIGAVIGFARKSSNIYLGPPDLALMSAFCVTTMTQVRRLEVKTMEKIKSDFLGSISHEMRTPLHGILSSLDLLADITSDKRQRELLQIAQYSGNSLLDTIDRVLLISNISSKAQSTKKLLLRRLSEGTVSQQDCSDQGSNASSHDIRSLSVTRACQDIIKEVVEKYHQKQTLRPELRDYLKRGMDKESAVASSKNIGSLYRNPVVLFDTNITRRYGLKAADVFGLVLTNLLEDPSSEGSGLGLPLVKRAVHSLDGTISVDSKLHIGTAFTATLPLNRVLVESIQDVPSFGSFNLHSTTADPSKLNAALFAPARWADEDDVRGRRCVQMLLESLSRNLQQWVEIDLTLWDSSSTSTRLLFVLSEDLEAMVQTYGNVLSNTSVIVLSQGNQIHMHTGPWLNITVVTGPIVPAALQEALAVLFSVSAPGSRLRNQEESEKTEPSTKRYEGWRKPESGQSSQESPFDLDLSFQKLGTNTPQTEDMSRVSPQRPSQSLRNQNSTASGVPRHVRAGSVSVISRLLTEKPVPQPRLLLVDDNTVNLRILGMHASKCSKLPFTLAPGGQEALDAFNATLPGGPEALDPYDMLFLDLSMPRVSGFDVAQQIRQTEARLKSRKRTYICALTSLVSAKDRKHAYESGVDEYLLKPSKVKELQAVVERWRDTLTD